MKWAKKQACRRLTPWFALLLCTLPLGCTGLTKAGAKTRRAAAPPAFQKAPAIQPVAYTEPQDEEQSPDDLPKPRPAPDEKDADSASSAPFAGRSVLSLDALVQAVLARNPTIAQMIAAWRAAQQRYPQVTSLEDPLFGGTMDPASFGSPNVNFAYIAQLSQRIPFPGKLRLRGEAAKAEANAAGRDVDDIRLQLIESARVAFFNFYLVDRSLEVNQVGLRLMEDYKKTDEDRYRSGDKKVTRQDIDQAEVEIGRLQERDLLLKRVRQVAVARINTLMHRLPDNPLPPAPASLAVRDKLPDLKTLYTTAWEQRPDLRALADRIAADRARVQLALKDYYPDFFPYAAYNKYMGNRSPRLPLAYFVGVGINLPVYRGRLSAAVAEARARLAERQAELARKTDQVNFEVQEAYARVLEAEKTARLYDEKILKAARLNIEDARSAYISGQIPFVSLIRAERDLVDLFDRYYQAVANYHSQLATLERVVGARLATLRGKAGQPGPLPGGPAGMGGEPCCVPADGAAPTEPRP